MHGNPPVPMIGRKFGRLTCIRKVAPRGKGNAYWYLFRCEDGTEVEANGSAVRSGNTTSCGCAQRDHRHEKATHGHTRGAKPTAAYRAWRNMITRCTNKNYNGYHRYGGRGIRVCDRWMRSFEAFLADMGPHPGVGYSIERQHNDNGYEPGNCHWATKAEQSRNRSNNRRITHDGTTRTLTDWAHHLGMRPGLLIERLNKYGMSFKEAISRPIGQHIRDRRLKSSIRRRINQPNKDQS